MTSRVTINTEALGIAWVAGQQFRIGLQEDFVREVGNTENPNPANANLITFTTNATGPTIATTTPADNTTAATGNVNARLVITFNRKIKVGSGNVQVYRSGSPDVLLLNVPTSDALISFADYEFRINVTGLIVASTSFYVRVDNGAIVDRDGFAFTGINNATTFNFTTAASTNVLFRDLSANITGAFSPQMIVGVIKKFTASITTASFNSTITARGTFRRGASLAVEANIAILPRADFKLKATTINCTANLTVSVIRRRRFAMITTAVFTTVFKIGFFRNTTPYREYDTQDNAITQNYINQNDIDNLGPSINEFSLVHSTAQFKNIQNGLLNALNVERQYNGGGDYRVGTDYILKIKYNNGLALTGSETAITIVNPGIADNERFFGFRIHTDFVNHRIITSGVNKTYVFNLITGAVLKTFNNPGSAITLPVNDANHHRHTAISQIKGNRIIINKNYITHFYDYDQNLLTTVDDSALFANTDIDFSIKSFAVIINEDNFLTNNYQQTFTFNTTVYPQTPIYTSNFVTKIYNRLSGLLQTKSLSGTGGIIEYDAIGTQSVPAITRTPVTLSQNTANAPFITKSTGKYGNGAGIGFVTSPSEGLFNFNYRNFEPQNRILTNYTQNWQTGDAFSCELYASWLNTSFAQMCSDTANFGIVTPVETWMTKAPSLIGSMALPLTDSASVDASIYPVHWAFGLNNYDAAKQNPNDPYGPSITDIRFMYDLAAGGKQIYNVNLNVNDRIKNNGDFYHLAFQRFKLDATSEQFEIYLNGRRVFSQFFPTNMPPAVLPTTGVSLGQSLGKRAGAIVDEIRISNRRIFYNENEGTIQKYYNNYKTALYIDFDSPGQEGISSFTKIIDETSNANFIETDSSVARLQNLYQETKISNTGKLIKLGKDPRFNIQKDSQILEEVLINIMPLTLSTSFNLITAVDVI